MSNIEIAKKNNYTQLNVTEYTMKEISKESLIKSLNSGTTTHKNSPTRPKNWPNAPDLAE